MLRIACALHVNTYDTYDFIIIPILYHLSYITFAQLYLNSSMFHWTYVKREAERKRERETQDPRQCSKTIYNLLKSARN